MPPGRAKVAPMNVNALRTWGIAAGSAVVFGALAISLQDPAPAQARHQSAVQLTQAPTQAASVAFLVRFQGSGPIARAQALAAQGQEARAATQVRAQLARQNSLQGLCFDRFTVGAAELVLRSCEPVAASEHAAYSQRWLARLQAMRAVAYVDANATATPEG